MMLRVLRCPLNESIKPGLDRVSRVFFRADAKFRSSYGFRCRATGANQAIHRQSNGKYRIGHPIQSVGVTLESSCAALVVFRRFIEKQLRR